MRDFSFRDQVAKDFKHVFLNPREFGRVCRWNGRRLTIVEGAMPGIVTSDAAPGIAEGTKEIYCRINDLPKPPKVTEMVLLDGEYWQTVDVKTMFGHRCITLMRSTS